VTASPFPVLRGERISVKLLDDSQLAFLRALPLGTQRTYHYQLERFAVFLASSGGDLHALTRADVQQYLQHLQNERKSASSLHTTYYAIAAWCRASGQTQATLSIRLPGRPRITALPVKSLDRSERNQLLRDVERDSNHRGNDRDTAIVYLLLFAGLRVSELVNLDIEDVTIGERSGSVRVLGKGNKERVVPLAAEARHWLTRYIGERSTGPLFLSNRKTRIHPNTIQKMLAQYRTHPHALRHTFGRTLAAAGADLPVIARLMGHEDVNVTMRYALPSEDELAEAIDRVFT